MNASQRKGSRPGQGGMDETLEGRVAKRGARDNPEHKERPRPVIPVPRQASSRWSNPLARSFSDALEDRRLFILLPFLIIAGLCASLATTSSPDNWLLSAGALILAIAIAFSLRRITMLRTLVAVSAFWCGFALLTMHGALFGTAMLERPAFGTFEARIDEVLAEGESGARLIVSDIRALGETAPVKIRRARIAIRGSLDAAPGDIISGPIRLAPVPGPVLPGSFDAQFHAYFDGIGAYGNTTGAVTVRPAVTSNQPDRFIAELRHGIANRIDAVLPQPTAGIARALINGDQSQISDQSRDVMATAGIAHVYSVSGLHLTIVAGGIFVILRAILALLGGLAGRLPVKPLAAATGILAALFYYAISGGNVAALRSTIMIVLIFTAVIFGRRALTMRNVAIAGVLVILTDPASVFRPSFQLSFAAVVALVGTFELVRSNPQRQRGMVRQMVGYFGGITLTSLVAGAATLIFSAYHFQQTSPLGVVGNLVTLPLVGFIMMPMAVFGVLLMPFGFEWLPLKIMGWSIDRMLDLAAIVAQWSGAIDASPLLTPTALIIALFALAWFAFFKDRYRLIGPALVLPAVLLFAMDRPPDIIISDTTQAVAVRGENGLLLATGKPGSFAVKVWEETYGATIAANTTGITKCDQLGCIAKSPLGFTVAIVKSAEALNEDCDSTDLLIARNVTPPRDCRARVIDSADLRDTGVQWLAWDGATRQFEVRTAITGLNRPWRKTP